MIEASTEAHEAQRLAALQGLQVLDTPPEERFDRITRLAARLFDTPIALVTPIDEHRQWFKSRVGLDLSETHRSMSFCAHAVVADAPLTIEDTHNDLRFVDNPLVTDDPMVRFYAGHPLHAPSGEAIGTVCVFDRLPRTFSPADAEALADLAALVEEELANRHRLDELEQRVHRDEMVAAVLEAMHESVIVLDAHGEVEFYSARSQSPNAPVELTRAHLDAINDRTIDVDGKPDSLMARIDELVHHGIQYSNVVLGLTVDGESSSTATNVENQSIQWFLTSGIRFGERSMVTSRDISELQALRRDLALSESARLASDQRYELIVRYASDIVSVVDQAGHVSFVSSAAFRLLGHSFGEGNPEGMLAYIDGRDTSTMLDSLRAVARSEAGSERPFVVQVRTAYGEPVHLECVAVNMPHHELADRGPTALVAADPILLTCRDVSERVSLTTLLERQAMHDPLTDLLNRRAIVEHIDGAVARVDRNETTVAVCFLDLDNFKSINDSAGHAAGDAVLIETARRLNAAVRAGDVVARIGRDEFIVVLEPVLSELDALKVAARILTATSEAIVFEGHELSAPPSVGLTISTKNDTAASLFARADKALYRAKSSGEAKPLLG